MTIIHDREEYTGSFWDDRYANTTNCYYIIEISYQWHNIIHKRIAIYGHENDAQKERLKIEKQLHDKGYCNIDVEIYLVDSMTRIKNKKGG